MMQHPQALMQSVHKLHMAFSSDSAGTYFTKWARKVGSQEVLIIFT